MLYEELKDRDFEIIAVALDTGGKAAVEARIRADWLSDDPSDLLQRLAGWSTDVWRRIAPPEYLCLIDEEHLVADLYGMTIVPMAVWIDEEGRIVRPTETAGQTGYFRRMDHETFQVPDEDAAILEQNRMVYFNAVRDWALKGQESEYALSPEEIRRRVRRPSENDARAAAHARIGRHLFQKGDHEASKRHFEKGVEFCPEQWNFRRQSMVLEPELVGELNTAPEFWAAVAALGERDYHPPIEMPGISGPPPWLKDTKI